MSLRYLLVLAFVFVGSVASAQTVSITGRLVDPQGAVVSGAVVMLNPSSAAARTTSSTADGAFSFAGVPAGLKVLQVESPGFERWIRNVAVSSATASFDVTLQLGGRAETVAVEAPKLEEELPQEVERAGSRIQTITSEQIENGGYDDVGQALQSLVPGLFLAPKAGRSITSPYRSRDRAPTKSCGLSTAFESAIACITAPPPSTRCRRT